MRPFALFCECEVTYEGRASSVLARGNYLIIYKPDGSLMIHGASLVKPLNYISANSELKISPGNIIISRKSEVIKIRLYAIYETIIPRDWSDARIVIRKTEAELTEKIASEPEKYFGPGHYIINREYPTPVGRVDLVLVSTTIYVVEVKRKKVILKDCYQVARYVDAFLKLDTTQREALRAVSNCPIVACLAGPSISQNAKKHCEERGLRYLAVDFEE